MSQPDALFWTDTEGVRIFHCPGCGCCHGLDQRWTMTGTAQSPTFRPSVVTENPRCHLFVTDGQIQYLTDCAHALAGKTVPMEPM